MSLALQTVIKKYFLGVSLAVFLLFSNVSNAQVFWTENFSTPSWTLNVPTGINDPDANYFNISDDEGGGITPNLGAPGSCGVASNGNNTLYVTSSLGAALGAAYFNGGFCGLGLCVTTNVRSESPTINCTGKFNITIDFNYIENGDGALDDAVMWYYDGATWSIIDNMPKTLTGCGGQGLWTSRSVLLPASANNNPNVKIGFGWVNNDDGLGVDPSFAVDDITASTPVGGSLATDPLPVLNYCSCANVNVGFVVNGAVPAAGNVYTAQLSDALGNFGAPTVIGTLPSIALSGTISCTIPCNTPDGFGYRIRVVSSNPALTGADNGANITIHMTPQVTITHNVTNCMDTLTANLANVGGPINGVKYYITDTQPWGVPDNVTAMNAVFGVGNWIQGSFATPPGTIFAPGTQFVFIDGSDANAIAMNTFMTANQALIENWVTNGGRLFLNSAPNQGGNMNWGFGGVTLDYNGGQATGNAVLPGHPIFQGPFVPVATNYTGSNFTHARIIGGATTPIMEAFGDVELSSKPWGSGLVLFGTMTQPFFHTPAPHAQNFRQNIIQFASGSNNAYNYSFLWSPTGDTTQMMIPPATGIYTVTVTNGGCSATATTFVNVVAPPTVTANANPTSVCPGGTTIFTAGGNAVSYTWSGGVIDGVPFVIPATGTYTVTGTNAAGCTATSTVTITANANLAVTASASQTGVCVGGSVTLTANGALNYTWNPGGLNGASVVVSPVATTTYTVTGSNGPGCSGTSIVTIYVNSIQNLTITLSGTPCNDTLYATATIAGGGGGVPNGTKYYITDAVPWGSPNNVNEMNTVFGVGNWIQGNFALNPATVFVPGTQFVFLEGGDFNGTALTNYMNANVALIETWVAAGGRLFLNAAPNNGGMQNWGFGGTQLNYINLIPAAINAVPGVQVTNLTHPINLGPYLPVDPNGQYTGNYFAHADVVNAGTTVIHNVANPAQSVFSEKIWGAGLVGFGGMTTTNWHNNVAPLVNAHAVNLRMNILFYIAGAPLPTPTATYTWSPGGATGTWFVPPATGIYTVTANVNGCTATATYNFTLNVPPVMTITASPSDTTCPGGNVTLTATGANTYQWMPGNLTGATININPMVTTTYTITGTSSAGCVSTITKTIVVTNNLPVTASVTPQSICQGQSATLSGGGAVTYNWVPGGFNGANVNVSPNVTTTYTVTGSDPAGCTGVASVTLVVNPTPVVTITANPTGPVCIGDPVSLTANGANTYIWTGGVVNAAPFYPVANSSYTVTGSSAAGCTSTASINLVTITPQAPHVNIYSNPAPTFVGQFTAVTAIVPAYIPNYTLNWYRNNTYFTTTVSPANSVSYVPNSLADSMYAYVIGNGCFDPDSARSNGITPRTPLSINDTDIPDGFSLYPVPSSGTVYVNGTIAGDKMVLTDMVGKTIMVKEFKDKRLESLDITALSSGVYHAKFIRGERSWVVKLRRE